MYPKETDIPIVPSPDQSDKSSWAQEHVKQIWQMPNRSLTKGVIQDIDPGFTQSPKGNVFPDPGFERESTGPRLIDPGFEQYPTGPSYIDLGFSAAKSGQLPGTARIADEIAEQSN